jgi:tRNA-dihydrouridine synthase
VDGVMIGQAAIGNPRVFTPHTPSLPEKSQTLLRHLDLSVACDQLFEQYNIPLIVPDQLDQQIHNNLQKSDFETHSTVEFRKFLFQYLKGIPDSRERKQTMLSVKKYGEMRTMIQQFFEKRLEEHFE